MLAPALDDLIGLSTPTQVAIWIPASLLILCSIGGAQAWVLRGVVEQPHRWIAANLLGWLAGLPWTFVLPALAQGHLEILSERPLSRLRTTASAHKQTAAASIFSIQARLLCSSRKLAEKLFFAS